MPLLTMLPKIMQPDMSAAHAGLSLRVRAQFLAFVCLASGLVAALMLSVSLGSVPIPLDAVATILRGGEPETATWTTIVLKFRLPKALTAALAGAALAVAGLQMQTLFRNPLAGPFVLGISSGASLGVALVVLSIGGTGATLLAGLGFAGEFGLALAASAGAAIVMVAVLLAAQRLPDTMTILILGLMFGYAANALVSVLLYFAVTERIQSYVTWTFGSFGGVTWSQLRVLGPAVGLALIIAHLSAKPLNALLLGETYARSMGVAVGRARLWVVSTAAILAGVVTAFCGPIAFVGVAVPHLCRGLFNTSDHRVLLPAVSMMGAILALIADMIAHLPGSQVTLPLNAVTALLGAPVVTWVILRRRNLRQAFAK
jgi:iron complex transport system permease protein